MDFKDWRTSAQEPSPKDQPASTNRFHGKRFFDHIEEQLREAEERGAFRDLPGMGQPLKLDTNPYAGEKALGYSLLKSNGYLPAEIELAREIERELERLEARRAALSKRGRDLRRRRVPPFASEKRAYNTSANNALAEYEAGLRELNRKILTFNLSTPASMHRAALDIERMVSEFREACPLFA
jgi:DnaJ homolog subfamily C member 28